MIDVPHSLAFSPERCSIHLTIIFASFCLVVSAIVPINADTLAAVGPVLPSAICVSSRLGPKRLTRPGQAMFRGLASGHMNTWKTSRLSLFVEGLRGLSFRPTTRDPAKRG